MATTVRAVVCLCLWLAACQVRGSHIPAKMNRTIQNLLQHYKITDDERFDGKPVFSREPLSGKLEAKMVFMGGVLETYEKLFGHMLKQLPTPSDVHPTSAVKPGAGTTSDAETRDIREGLNSILDKVKELKTRRYHEQAKLLHGLSALKKIQMNNTVVQSKALWELPWLFEEASTLSENNVMKRRRRRHARRAKTHLRA